MLYGPKSRLRAFPEADFAFLICAATNVARAFAFIHAQGDVIGDVNHANVLISKQGTASLIDCDSFQVCDPETGRRYLCTVGLSTHQPPEFQTPGSFAGQIRCTNHDAFGLAVLIFQLLFMGRHPYSGRFLGSGDMPIETAIRDGRFAYGGPAAGLQMQPPPGSLPLSAVPILAPLFERAFADLGAAPPVRPDADEWISALTALAMGLQGCSRSPAHAYPVAANACPWCKIEQTSGALLFGLRLGITFPLGGSFHIELVWQMIAAVQSPGLAPTLPRPASLGISPSADALQSRMTRRTRLAFALALTMLGAIGWIVGVPIRGAGAFWTLAIAGAVALCIALQSRQTERARARLVGAAARRQWDDLGQRWSRDAGDEAFQTRRQQLEKARREYNELSGLRRQQIRQLDARRRERQLEQFLDRFRIVHSKIHNIGPARVAILLSYGIETAADVRLVPVLAVPGLGPSLAAELVRWRRLLEGRFRFDPSLGVDPADVARIDQDLARTRARLEQILGAGPSDLRRLAHQAELRREAMLPALDQALQAAARAEADLKVL